MLQKEILEAINNKQEFTTLQIVEETGADVKEVSDIITELYVDSKLTYFPGTNETIWAHLG